MYTIGITMKVGWQVIAWTSIIANVVMRYKFSDNGHPFSMNNNNETMLAGCCVDKYNCRCSHVIQIQWQWSLICMDNYSEFALAGYYLDKYNCKSSHAIQIQWQ